MDELEGVRIMSASERERSRTSRIINRVVRRSRRHDGRVFWAASGGTSGAGRELRRFRGVGEAALNEAMAEAVKRAPR